MTRISARLDASDQILAQFMTFSKKAIEEISRQRKSDQANRETEVGNEDQCVEALDVLLFEGTDLLKLGGGNSFREMALAIANRLLTEEERIKYCVDTKKQLDRAKERVPADEERAGFLRRAMKFHMKDQFNEESYRAILKHVNQQGTDFQRRKRKSEQKDIDKENLDPTSNDAGDSH